jgi:hypothetical protein
MAEAAPDGLASLSAQRNRARRSMPPPRHPVAAGAADRAGQVVSVPEQMAEPIAPAASLTAVPAAEAPKTAETVGAADTEPFPPASRAPGVGAPVKVTLYVDRESDEFMEAARVEGLVARPKVDISRSAVVRLALRRLMSEMSAAEVKAVLEQQEVRSSGPGRKRR